MTFLNNDLPVNDGDRDSEKQMKPTVNLKHFEDIFHLFLRTFSEAETNQKFGNKNMVNSREMMIA